MQARKVKKALEELRKENPEIADNPDLRLADALLKLNEGEAIDPNTIADTTEKRILQKRLLQKRDIPLDEFIEKMNQLKDEWLGDGDYHEASTIVDAMGKRVQKELDAPMIAEDPYIKVETLPSRPYFTEAAQLLEWATVAAEEENDLNKAFHLIAQVYAENETELPE